MIIWGRLIGAAIGIPAGVFGVILGYLVGWLVDLTIKVSRQNASLQAFLTGRGPIRGAKTDARVFVATVAVMMRVASANGSATIRQVEMMRDWLSDRFRVSEQGSFGLSRVVDEAYRLRENIDVARACETLREVFEEDETAALIVFLTDLADSDAHGLTSAARARIRDIGVRLGVNAAAIDLVLTRNPKLDEDACAILGLPTDATADEVRRVYRLLASQFHPDSAAGLTAEQVRQSQEAFVRIKAAYDRLIAQLGAD